MTLSYDQRSELRWAFEEAYVEPERRRASRVKHKVPAKLLLWKGKPKPVAPIDVTIEDFSTTGVGLVHAHPLKVGERYVLEVPRPEKPLWVVLRVVRCLPMDDGNYAVGLEASEMLDPANFRMNPFTFNLSASAGTGANMNSRRRLKIVFILFGIAGTAVAAFMHS